MMLGFPTYSSSYTRDIGLFRVRSPLLAESLLMSFPPGTEMFQFPGFASKPYVFRPRYPEGWVSPFRNLRINDRSHLPAAYRSVPRLSSPLGAKASTERPYHAQDQSNARTQYQTAHRAPGCAELCISIKPYYTHNSTLLLLTKSLIHLSNNIPMNGSPKATHAHWRSRSSRHFRQTEQPSTSNASTKPLIVRGYFHGKAAEMEATGFEPTTPCLQSRCSPI